MRAPRINSGTVGDLPARNWEGRDEHQASSLWRSPRLPLAAFNRATAQQPKSGGILQMYHRDNPPSMSIHEEATDLGRVVPFMGVFNNLVMYDQHKAQNTARDDRARPRRRAGRGARTARR